MASARQLPTEANIKAALAEALTMYRAVAQTAPAPHLAQLSETVQGLQAELGAYYAHGAQPCPQCGNLPHGMERRAGLYEVGCLACLPQAVQVGVLTYRRSPAAQGKTAQEAVSNWNAGKWMEVQVQ